MANKKARTEHAHRSSMKFEKSVALSKERIIGEEIAD
jgi:hypothetical protein